MSERELGVRVSEHGVPFMDLNSAYMESSSQSATNKSCTVAYVRELSREATRPRLDRICLQW